jgi:hypothetical protein
MSKQGHTTTQQRQVLGFCILPVKHLQDEVLIDAHTIKYVVSLPLQ